MNMCCHWKGAISVSAALVQSERELSCSETKMIRRSTSIEVNKWITLAGSKRLRSGRKVICGVCVLCMCVHVCVCRIHSERKVNDWLHGRVSAKTLIYAFPTYTLTLTLTRKTKHIYTHSTHMHRYSTDTHTYTHTRTRIHALIH
jgi:hypothetical protein